MSHIEACLSCSSGNETGFVWDVENCQPLHSIGQLKAQGKGLCYAERQHLILSQHPDKPQAVIHYPTKAQPRFRCSMPEKMLSVDISSNGVYAVGGGVSGKLYIWQVASGALMRIFDAHYKGVNAVKFTPCSGYVVSGSEDAIVKSWSLAHVLDVTLPASAELRPLHSSSLHTLGVTSVLVAGNGWVASAGKDRTLRVHDFVLNQDLHCCILPSLPRCIAATPQLTQLFAGCGDGKIYQSDLYPERVWSKNAQQKVPQDKLLEALLGHQVANMTEGKESSLGTYQTAMFEGHTGGVSALAVTLDGLSLVSGGADGNVHVWQIASKQLLRTFSQHKSPVTALSLIIVPSKMPSEKESQLTHPFSALKKVAITGDNEDDYICSAYHAAPAASRVGKDMFAENDFGKRKQGGRRNKRRRTERGEQEGATNGADPTTEKGQGKEKAEPAPTPAAPTPAATPAANIIGSGDSESLEVIAKLYNVVAVQQQEILKLRAASETQ